MGEPDPDPRVSDAERLAREVNRQDLRVIESVARRGPRTARDAWTLSRRIDAPRVVEALPPAAYALPPHARKILSPSCLQEIEAILGEIRAANDEVVGLDATVASLLLSEEELAVDVRERLRRWAESYVSARLAKPSPKDTGGDQVLRFKRIYLELLPALEEIATREGGAHYAFMGELLDYVPWLIFQGTWRDMLETEQTCRTLNQGWRVVTKPEHEHYCREVARLYSWAGADDALRAVRALRKCGPIPQVDDTTARQQLATMAAEIREVRPFVITDHNPEKCSAEVAPGLWVSWFWGGSQQLGIVPVHDDARKRVAEFRSLKFTTSLRVRHDGLLASEFAPWIDMDDVLETEPDGLAANVAIVGALHGRLLEVFGKIDLDAAYGRVREAAAGAEGAETPTQEAVAATFTVAESSPVQPALPVAPGESGRPKVRVPTLRLERFLAILERLGCEVRQGKGSEVVAFRTGGRIARIGRHTRNREVPSMLVQRVLHQVGVTLAEWVEALGG